MKDEDRTPEERIALSYEARPHSPLACAMRAAFDALRAERDAAIAERERLRGALSEAEECLRRHVPEGHGAHPNPEFEIVERIRAALKEPADAD